MPRHLSVFYWREKICYRTVDGHIYEHCRMFYGRGLVERHYKPFSQTSRNRQGTIRVRHRCWQLWQSTCLTTTKPNSFEDLTWPSEGKMLLLARSMRGQVLTQKTSWTLSRKEVKYQVESLTTTSGEADCLPSYASETVVSPDALGFLFFSVKIVEIVNREKNSILYFWSYEVKLTYVFVCLGLKLFQTAINTRLIHVRWVWHWHCLYFSPGFYLWHRFETDWFFPWQDSITHDLMNFEQIFKFFNSLK